MLTLLLYVLIVGLVAALLFLVASAVFGRGEELGPLPEGTTVTVLPAAGIRGADVRALRFQQVFRGYKAGEVDWALSRLAARIDELEAQLAQGPPPTSGPTPGSPPPPGTPMPPAGPTPATPTTEPQSSGTTASTPDADRQGPAGGATTNFGTGGASPSLTSGPGLAGLPQRVPGPPDAGFGGTFTAPTPPTAATSTAAVTPLAEAVAHLRQDTANTLATPGAGATPPPAAVASSGATAASPGATAPSTPAAPGAPAHFPGGSPHPTPGPFPAGPAPMPYPSAPADPNGWAPPPLPGAQPGGPYDAPGAAR